MTAFRLFIVTVCIAIVSACGTVMAPPRSGFLTDYAALSQGPDGSSALMRSTRTIDPARVALGDIEWRASTSADVSEEERRLLLRQLGDELMARVHELPPARGGRPAVLRAAITHVETVSPALNAASALLLVVPLDRGGAWFDIEAVDPDTGEQLAALTVGDFVPLSEFQARFSKLAPARLALRKAAAEFGRLLRLPATSGEPVGTVAQTAMP
jgi:hypothetical protein